VLATYVAVVITLTFATPLNDTCGRPLMRAAGVTRALLVADYNSSSWSSTRSSSSFGIFDNSSVAGTSFQLRRGACLVYFDRLPDGSPDAECEATLVDRRTYFEQNLFYWVGQLVLVLFTFTSLFKPSRNVTITYTALLTLVGAAGCVYQGFEFWDDSARVLESGVGQAISLFLSAALLNVYAASVMAKLESALVASTSELDSTRFAPPTGSHVVFIKAEIEGAQELMAECPLAFEKALALARDVVHSLQKEFFGTELTQDSELKNLLSLGGTGAMTPEVRICAPPSRGS
jgi:hypothetical protein